MVGVYSLWQAGNDARLNLECLAGKAQIHLQLNLHLQPQPIIIRILFLLDWAVGVFLIIKVLPLLTDEVLADVLSLVEGLVVDGLV